jgi:Rab5 GDP/GTP exchange factor
VGGVSRTPTPHLDIAGMQEEIDRVHENAAAAAKDTLRQIFPGMDVEVVEWVLEANGGDVGKSVEALLEMSGGG